MFPPGSATEIPFGPVFSTVVVRRIHLWRADEAGDEDVCGAIVKLERRADLLDAAAVEDNDLVGHGHGFDLVVGDVDHRCGQSLVQAHQFQPHIDAQCCIEIGKRFVEQEDLRIAHDRPADGDTLPLAARQILRSAVEQMRQFEDMGGVLDLPLALGQWDAGNSECKAHVFGNRHMRIERVGLKHHRQAALRRIDVVGPRAVDHQIAAVDFLQAGDHAQKRGLAAAGRADEDDEFAVVHIKVDALDDFKGAVGLTGVAECEISHCWPPLCRRKYPRQDCPSRQGSMVQSWLAPRFRE